MAVTTKMSVKESTIIAYNYMINKLGYSEMTARAIMGNLLQESQLDPNVVNSIGATGIAQWLGSRKARLKKQPNWDTIEGQLDFMDKEFKTTEKKAWKEIQKAKTLDEATIAVRKHYERPGKDEARDDNRIKFAQFDEETGTIPNHIDQDTIDLSKQKIDRNAIRAEVVDKYNKQKEQDYIDKQGTEKRQLNPNDLIDPEGFKEAKRRAKDNGSKTLTLETYAKDQRAIRSSYKSPSIIMSDRYTDDDLIEIEKQVESIVQEKQKAIDGAIAKIKDRDERKIIEANQAAKSAEQQKLDDADKTKFDDQLKAFVGEGFEEEIDFKQIGFEKPKKKFTVPFAALGQGALGLMGLAESDTEIPLREEEISEATMAYLAENKRLAKIGLPPELEAKAKRELSEATAFGISNLTKASGGNKNLILGNLGSIDANRMKAIANLNIADQEAKDKAFARYGQTLSEIDKFNQDKERFNHSIKMDEAIEKRTEGKALANSAFSNMLEEIQYQKDFGPGSANANRKTQMDISLFGYSHSVEKGAGSYDDFLQRKESVNKENQITRDNNLERQGILDKVKNLTYDQQLELQRSGKSIEDYFSEESIDLYK